jgi:uncharacterized protein involved in type VI secretion and phage assembly
MRQLNGVFPVVVIDNVDPENLGRVKVRLPQVGAPGQQGSETWARMATLMAGKNRGTWFIPDVNDEVLVAFEAGDVRRPYVIGCLWSGTNSPPETMDTNNNKKLLRSRSGVKITLDDQSGRESFMVETPGGQRVTLKDGPSSIEFTDNSGNSVKLDTNGIRVNAHAKVTINASQVELNSGLLSVNAGMAKFSGVVQCDTLVSNSVVSASYTPGVGNIS